MPSGSFHYWLEEAVVSNTILKGEKWDISVLCALSLSACHDSCSTCEGPLATHCTSCSFPLALHQGQCLQGCGEGFYQDHNICKGKLCTWRKFPSCYKPVYLYWLLLVPAMMLILYPVLNWSMSNSCVCLLIVFYFEKKHIFSNVFCISQDLVILVCFFFSLHALEINVHCCEAFLDTS